jgi:hypothetical protein
VLPEDALPSISKKKSRAPDPHPDERGECASKIIKVNNIMFGFQPSSSQGMVLVYASDDDEDGFFI